MGNVKFPAEAVPGVRADMYYQLDKVFEKAGRLAKEYASPERQRHPRELSAELAALLPELGGITANLDGLGWDHSRTESAVTLDINDAINRMIAGRRSSEGDDA